MEYSGEGISLEKRTLLSKTTVLDIWMSLYYYVCVCYVIRVTRQYSNGAWSSRILSLRNRPGPEGSNQRGR